MLEVSLHFYVAFSPKYCFVSIVKTAACIQATAISRANNVNKSKNVRLPQGLEDTVCQTTQEQRNISRWPASKFAPNRNPSVRGCIHSLTSSIITIKGIR